MHKGPIISRYVPLCSKQCWYVCCKGVSFPAMDLISPFSLESCVFGRTCYSFRGRMYVLSSYALLHAEIAKRLLAVELSNRLVDHHLQLPQQQRKERDLFVPIFLLVRISLNWCCCCCFYLDDVSSRSLRCSALNTIHRLFLARTFLVSPATREAHLKEIPRKLFSPFKHLFTRNFFF